jgi:hypothetical protein
MPFRLTNALATFQSCMNHIFRDQLRKPILFFFNDILIYSLSWKEHMRHLDEVLSIMEAQSLYAKESKCKFGMTELLYLGHIISAQGVQVHQEKIRAILLVDAQERDKIEELLWVVQLLQAVRPGFFSAWSTVDRSYQAWGLHMDREITGSL